MATGGGNRFNAWTASTIAYHVVLTVVLFAGAFHFNHRISVLERQRSDGCSKHVEKSQLLAESRERNPKPEVNLEEGVRADNLTSQHKEPQLDEREILSGESLRLALRGPPGSPGRDGRDRRDAPSLASIERFINSSAALYVEKEWRRFQTAIPSYGGSLYVRWGRRECTETSKLVYNGIAAGSDFRSSAGGSNIQCLPSDPEYDPKYKQVQVLHSFLSKVVLENLAQPDVFGADMFRAQLPCAVCEAKQRVSKFMFPAATKCPSSDWTLEYKGFLMSDYNMLPNGTPHTNGNRHHRSTYECMDEHPVSTHPGVASGFTEAGTLFRLTKTSCSGDTSINLCPPYDPFQPLSCVVCTK